MLQLVTLMNESNEDQVVSNNAESNQMESDQTVVHGNLKILNVLLLIWKFIWFHILDFELFEKHINKEKKQFDLYSNGFNPKKLHNVRSDWKLIGKLKNELRISIV